MIGLLIIDDEEGIRRALKRLFRHDEEYEIFLADGGKEAISIVEDDPQKVGIVVSDFKMPGLDGIETLDAIGKLNPDATRILLTGYATLDSAIEATNIGLDGFLIKPFDNVELKAKIKEYFVKKRMRQFVSEQVFNVLKDDPSAVHPRKQEITTLFTDIRGFTSMSEKLEPETLAILLEKYYFSPLGQIVFDNNGTLDKHIGDSIMAIFGGPVSYEDDAFRAVKTAIEMREKLNTLNNLIKDDKDLADNININEFKLNMGIGIGTGEAAIGIFGSSKKREYTAIGRCVNLAARLEGKALGNEILICENTYEKIKDKISAEFAGDDLELKGIDRKIKIYRVKNLL